VGGATQWKLPPKRYSGKREIASEENK